MRSRRRAATAGLKLMEMKRLREMGRRITILNDAQFWKLAAGTRSRSARPFDPFFPRGGHDDRTNVAVGRCRIAFRRDRRRPDAGLPTPGPEHAILAKDVGTWDAVIEMGGIGGAPAMTSKGVEVGTVGCGGLCLVGGLQRRAHAGHAIRRPWPDDLRRQEEEVRRQLERLDVGTLQISEGTYDPAAKSITGWMEGTGPWLRAPSSRPRP